MERLRERSASWSDRLSEWSEPLFWSGLVGLAMTMPLLWTGMAARDPGLVLIGCATMTVFSVAISLQPSLPPCECAYGDGGIASMSDEEFDRLLDEVERSGRLSLAWDARDDTAVDADEFEELVRDALDGLPRFVQEDLSAGNLAVVVSNGGDECNAFGLFMGGTVADDAWHNRILVFRDTLTRYYGDDPDELRFQVAITVRHEVAHFYGADEQRVQDLGL